MDGRFVQYKTIHTPMNGKKHIETHFLKFLLDKYSNEELPQQDVEEKDETDSEIRRKLIQKLDQIEDPPPDEESDDIVDELLEEYRKLKRQYENLRVSNRRK